MPEQFGGLHQAALADQPRSHAPFGRPGKNHPAPAQDAHIVLRGGVGVDAHIHGRRNEQGTAGGQCGDG